MRLPIFWRVFCAQLFLIVLILPVSLYALFQLDQLTRVHSYILSTDTVCIEEEQHLLKIFLSQMRSAEKYLLLRDGAFLGQFTQAGSDFLTVQEKIVSLIDSSQERDLITQIQELHAGYAAAFATALTRNSEWQQQKTALSDGVTERINELIRLREAAIHQKTVIAHDQAALAVQVMDWLTVAALLAAVVLSYFSARGVSRPLKTLAQELRYVGKGEFRRSSAIRGPKEIGELARAFNWMSERLAELEAMKADFIAHVSHELRTPLTAIQEGTALLLEEVPGPLSASQREILQVVRSHGERLYHSLSSMLDLSKMEAGMMEYVRVLSDLRLLIDRSVETVRLAAQKKDIQLQIESVSSLPLLSCDEQRMQQVLDNLLVNAVKFTSERGTVTVSAALKAEEDNPRGWVEVRVCDSGPGIPPEEVERIFDKFYQSSHHRAVTQRGTGLGLALVRHIVEAHGGRVWVESRLGEGSTFVFLLPVTPEGNNAAQVHGKDAALSHPNGVANAA
jgi:two-component system sensor histidine kinase GlrK